MADRAGEELVEALKADLRERLGPKLLALHSAIQDERARRQGVTYVEWPSDIEVPEGFDTK